MDPGIYKIIHFVGLIILFVGMGSLLASDAKKPAAFRAPAMLHGFGLLLMLVSGFGLQAKLEIGFPIWLIAKIGIFVLLGGMIVVIKRKLIPTAAIYFLIVALGSTAAYLGFANSLILRP